MQKETNLTPAQQEAVSELNQNLQIIACAGSGKTEVITRRIANILQKKPDVKPENIVAFTFTNKAADSMRARIASALNSQGITGLDTMFIGTIHSFCNDILTKSTEQFHDYKILDTVKEHLFVERYYKACGMCDLELENFPRNIELFLQCIEKMIDDFDNTDAWEPTHQEVLNKYIQCLYSHKYIDFSLVIFETLRQMESNPQIKARLDYLRPAICPCASGAFGAEFPLRTGHCGCGGLRDCQQCVSVAEEDDFRCGCAAGRHRSESV